MTDEFRTSSLNSPRGYSMGTYATTRTVGGKVEAGLENLTLGLEAFSRYWSASTQMAGMAYKPQASIPDVETIAIGAYVEYRKSLRDNLRLELGGRVRQGGHQRRPVPGEHKPVLRLQLDQKHVGCRFVSVWKRSA